MEKIIVYVNDTAHALQQLVPMKLPTAAGPVHWIVVACPPRMTRHISRWVAYSARETWRAKWSEKVFAAVVPTLQNTRDQVVTLVAKGELIEMTETLQRRYWPARVLDARLPLVGQDLMPVTASQPTNPQSRWALPGAVMGMGAVLALAAD